MKGGHGSHWMGCEDTHHDCALARLADLRAALREIGNLARGVGHDEKVNLFGYARWATEMLDEIARRAETAVGEEES